MYKNTKVERKILEVAQKHLKAMRDEFHKNDRFRNEIGIPPAEFEVPADYTGNEELEQTQPAGPIIREHTEAPGPVTTDNPMPEAPNSQTPPQEFEPQITELPTETPRQTRVSREL